MKYFIPPILVLIALVVIGFIFFKETPPTTSTPSEIEQREEYQTLPIPEQHETIDRKG